MVRRKWHVYLRGRSVNFGMAAPESAWTPVWRAETPYVKAKARRRLQSARMVFLGIHHENGGNRRILGSTGEPTSDCIQFC